MGRIFTRTTMKGRRRDLRNHLTPAEKILWSGLRSRRLCGVKFRRQHSIGHYVVDFYCPDVRLVVEVDGPIHDTPRAREYDRIRTVYIETFDIRVVRFRNHDVEQHLSQVLEELGRIITERLPLLAARALPRGAGERDDPDSINLEGSDERF